MYQNYIFDLYGTLVDIRTDESSAGFWRKAVSVFAGRGASFSPGELRGLYHKYAKQEIAYEKLCHPLCRHIDIDLLKVFAKLYRKKGVEPDEQMLNETARRFREASTLHIRLYDGARDLLESLKAAGKRVYLLSNAQRSFTVPELESLDILKYFDGVMISSDERICKPERQFFERLMKRYDLSMIDSIMIGNDKNSDILGANRAGLDSLYIHQDISSEVKDESEIHAKWKIMDGDVRKIKEYVLEA